MTGACKSWVGFASLCISQVLTAIFLPSGRRRASPNALWSLVADDVARFFSRLAGGSAVCVFRESPVAARAGWRPRRALAH